METYEDYMDEELKLQMRNDFATALEYYMRRDNVNQQDLINALGLNKSTISNWVNGRRMPRPQFVRMLARYFHVSEEDMRRLPAWIDFAECEEADITDELYELSHMLPTIKTIKVEGRVLPDYIKQNIVSAIKVALDYAKDTDSK